LNPKLWYITGITSLGKKKYTSANNGVRILTGRETVLVKKKKGIYATQNFRLNQFRVELLVDVITPQTR